MRAGGSIGATVPIIGLIIPVGIDPDWRYLSEALESVSIQTIGKDKIIVICVMKKIRANGITTMGRTDLCVKSIPFYVENDDDVTTTDQVAKGIEFARTLNLEYLSIMSSNDKLGKEKLEEDIRVLSDTPDARVIYPSMIYCDDEMTAGRPIMQHDSVTFSNLATGNFLSDMVTFPIAFTDVPFDPQYQMASFWIWYFRIWEKYGPKGFVHSPKSLYFWRNHSRQLSANKKYLATGKKHINEWLVEFAERNKGRTVD